MSAPSERSVGEHLGYARDSRLAVVHADDFGMCHAQNLGVLRALREGAASSASLMVPCPWFPAAATLATHHGGFDLGVHLTLTSEWSGYRWGPVAGASAVPSLCDAEGYLPRTVDELRAKAKPDEVEIELRAQIEQTLAAGIDVTHLDAHMGAAFLPPFTEVYAQLLRDYRLPGLLVRPQIEQAAKIPALREMLDRIVRVVDELEADGFPVFDAIDDDSLSFAAGEGEAHNLQRLDGLGAGLTYFICHPAEAADDLRSIDASAHCREFEASFYGSDAAREALAVRGIETVAMKQLRELLRREVA